MDPKRFKENAMEYKTLQGGTLAALAFVSAVLAACGDGSPDAESDPGSTEPGFVLTLGATEVLPRTELEGAGRPLQKAVYSAVVDSVGGETLANAIARTKPHGIVTACGLAGSPALPSSVMPFILRGVTLAGIDSVWADADDRADAWRILARGVDPDRLDAMTSRIGLDDVIAAGEDLLAGRRHGRTLVTI